MQEAFKKIIIALSALALLAFVANLLADNPYTHRLVRAAVNEKVEENTNLTIDFKAIKVSIVPPGAELYGFALASKLAPDTPLIAASHMRARLSVWALVLGKFRLSLVESDDLTLQWPPPFGFSGFLKEKPLVGPPEAAKPQWPPDFDLPVDNIVLNNTKVYADIPLTQALPLAPTSMVTAMSGIDIDLSYGGWNDMRAKIHVQSIDAALDASSLVEDTNLDAIAVLAGNQLALPTLKVRGERLNYEGSVSAQFQLDDKTLDAIDINAAGDVHGDLSLLGSYLDLSNTRGRVQGNVTVQASAPIASEQAASVLVDGQAQIQDGYLSGFRLHNSKAKFHITPQVVGFPDIEIILSDNRSVGHARGDIKLTDALQFDFHAAPDGLGLGELLTSLGADFELIETNIASPDLRIWGTGEPFLLQVSATGQFTDIDTPTIIYDRQAFPEKPACRLDFHLTVNDAALDFGGTHGSCFQPAGVKLAMPTPGTLSPPHGVNATASIAAAGHVFFDSNKGLNLDIRSEGFDLSVAQYFAQQAMSGKATTHTRIHGPTSHVLIDNEASVQNLIVRGIPLGNAHGFATVDGLTLRWHDVMSDLDGQGVLRSQLGTLGINDDYPIHTKLSAEHLTPAMSQRIFNGASASNSPFTMGIDHLEATIDGPLFFPGAWRSRVTFAAFEGDYEGQRLFDAGKGVLTGSAEGWSTDDASLTLGALRMGLQLRHQRAFPFKMAEARGSQNHWASVGLHPDDRFSLTFDTLGDAETADFDHLGTLPYVGEMLKSGRVEGAIQLHGKVEGRLSDVQGQFTGSIQRPKILGATMTPVNFKGFVTGSRLDMVMDHSGGALEGRMSVDVVEPNLPYEWYFNFNRMDLRAFGTEAFHRDPRNFLYLTAAWHMKGRLSDWWRSVGELEIKDVRAKYVHDLASQSKIFQFRQEQPVTLRLTGSEWKFDGDRELYLNGQNMQLRVSMKNSHPPEEIGLHLESIIDMALAHEFSPEIDTASGKIRLIADVNGPVSKPKPHVELTDLKPNPWIAATWKPVSIGLADVRPELKNVHMHIVYEDQRLMIDSFSAEKGTGTISASGGLNFADGAAAEDSRIDVAFNDATVIFPVAFLKSFEAQLSGNLALSGTQPPFKLTGDIKINHARSTKEVDVLNEIVNALRSSSFKTSVKSAKPTVQFDLTVNADQTINIHNRNLQCLLSTALTIKGTDLAPSITGQVEFDKGKFIYKRDFQFQRGVVVFDDPVKPDPSLDILAVSEVESYRVYIAVTGRASNPTVEFSVDPPNREDGTPISKVGILVLLSRGKLPDDSSNFEQTTRGTATSEALNLILGQYEEPVERLFDLSGQSIVRNVYIDVHPSSDSEENGTPVPRLNLPLDLGDDFDVVVRAETNASEVSAEYDIHDNIRVSGTVEKKRDEATKTTGEQTVNPASDTKLDLKFRFSFE